MEILVANRPHGHQPIRAGFIKFHKYPETGNTADAACELRADALAQISREIPVRGVPLGHHGASLRVRNMKPCLLQLFMVFDAQTVLAPPVRRDQRAMYDQIGITTNG